MNNVRKIAAGATLIGAGPSPPWHCRPTPPPRPPRPPHPRQRQIAKAIGAYAGLPARYEALPREAIAPFGDMAEMFRWFAETPAYQADFEATRALVPDVFDLGAWLASSNWTPVA
ncbi:hypothetical protein [Arthrobacter sp. NPDC058192]|uniref:hypothetical protein n=1 Tax=Arthrobacter sp. NPDC058192 TaxID=3346372 RepID=UPI0036F1383A